MNIVQSGIQEMSHTIPLIMMRMSNYTKNTIHWQKKEEKVIFGGRLGEYKYYDMDQVVEAALKRALTII